jgi:hypothetical protein
MMTYMPNRIGVPTPEQLEAEATLTEYRDVAASRDTRVRHAHTAGVSKHRISVLSGLARSTVYDILNGDGETARP